MKESGNNSKSQSPGSFITRVNHYLHEEPISSWSRIFFWFSILVFFAPLIGIFHLLRSVRLLVSYFRSSKIEIDATTDSKELAVYITGCDTGFGQLLSLVLAERGFVVFASCVTDNGLKQYDGNSSIFPIKVDVTKDDDVIKASNIVSDWLRDTNSKKRRVLHAIVNNAGIGKSGLVDWIPLLNYQKCMDVNYFGTIRTTKAFLPILKEQASKQIYGSARIINMVSMAGLGTSAGSSPYFCSKHAVEAFSSCLRIEMMSFNVKVVTFNPSFHATDIVKNEGPNFRKDWEMVDAGIREEYGVKYFETMYQNSSELMIRMSWDAGIVKDLLVRSIEAYNPDPQYIVGSDAKYLLILLRFLPAEIVDKVHGLRSFETPAKMMKA